METFVGPPPPGLEVRHLDGVSHNNLLSNLVYGTHLENMRDRLIHGTHHEVNKTHCPQGHPYSAVNTYLEPPRNNRKCRTCRRERNLRAYYARKIKQ